MSDSVVIVGGGLAGMAAAGALASRGLRVTLLESRPRWGGRASSFVDQTTGEVIDNCQHVVLGCCTAFQALMKDAGCSDWLRREPVLWFIGPEGSVNTLQSSSLLPAPLHLALAFGRFRYFSFRDKLRLALGLRALARLKESPETPRESFHDWLVRHGQTPELISRFWHVVLVSALSEDLPQIDVFHARKVFVDGFLRNREGWEMWVPSVPLDRLYGEGLIGWLTRLGVTSRTQAGVRRVVMDGDRVTGVELRNGERVSADHVILAVPHHLVRDLLPESLASHPTIQAFGKLQDAPISSVHLWFDRKVVPLPHAVLIDRLSQWVFDRADVVADQSQPETDNRANPGQYLQVVISASRDVQARPQAEIIQQVRDELAAIWPAVRGARVTHSRIVTEHRAALSVVPGVDRLRPVQQSPIANLQFAGDWTLTGWPSTMEGAVRSGLLAAQNVLQAAGRPESLVPPDLPTATLSRWLLNLR